MAVLTKTSAKLFLIEKPILRYYTFKDKKHMKCTTIFYTHVYIKPICCL